MWKSYFSESFWKSLLRILYAEILYPAAQAYVQKTDNEWDDTALKFMDDFIKDFLADAEDQPESDEPASL